MNEFKFENELVETVADSKEPPVLSSEALPGLLGQFIEVACEHSEADPALVAATFLARFGIECGDSAYFQVGESKHPARLFVVGVGESSKARKGTSAGPVRTIFENISTCQVSPGPLSSGEGIIFAVCDEIANSGTKNHQSNPGAPDKRLFVLDEEFANALHATKREGNTLSSILRTLYDSGIAEPLTKHNRIKTT